MSNKKDSSVVESTVVKKGVASTNKTAETSKAKVEDGNAHYDSIAQLKAATDIVDADGKPVDNTAKSDQADKKAKLKEELVNEAKEIKEANDPSSFDTKEQSKSTTTDKEDKAADKPDSNKNSESEKAQANKSKAADTAENTNKDSKVSTADDATKKVSDVQKNDKKSVDDAKKEQEADNKPATKRAAPKKKSNTKMSAGQHRVAILGGNRIPFARSNGAYSDVSNTDMLTAALNGLIERYNIQDELLGEVVDGAVIKLSRDIN